MNKKGQVAFESLLLLLIVITAATLITTMYFQIHDETLALGYARTGVLEEISNQNSNAIIERIYFQRNETTPKIIISLSETVQIKTTKIQTLITTNTGIKNITIEIQ